MTKENAIEYIKIWCPYDKQNEIIEALSAEPQEWISVKDRLPELGQMVLVTYADGDVETNERMTLKNLEVWKYGNSVVAWMPLPSPYKGDEK